MFKVRIAVLAVAAAALLCACSSLRGGAGALGEPEYGGIQTRSLGAAPESREAQNESRPLSELNTPDAIAAREAAARNASAGGGTGIAPAAKAQRVAAAAGPVPIAVSPHQLDGLQKGAKVRLRDGAGLHARPSQGGEVVPTTAGTEVELGPQVYNASGYWCYVISGRNSGWVSQSDIQR